MAAVVPEFDRAALEAAGERLGIRLLVLFGSHATGVPVPGPESDLDLAMSFTAGRERPGYWEVHRELSAVFPDHAVDVVFLGGADPLFRWEILREGVLLVGDPIAHLELRAFAYRDFVDSADLRELERVLFDKKLAFIKQRLHAAT